MADITDKITKAEGKLADYYRKLDDDFNLWDLKETKYETHETAINVTTSEPRLFADSVQTDISSAEMQILVKCPEGEGEEEREKAGKLERLFDFLFSQADDRLTAVELPPLKKALIWLFTIRGFAGVRILNYKEKDKIVPNYLPLDPRFLTHEVGGSGLSWVAHKIFKTKTQLEDEWGYSPQGSPWRLPWGKEKDVYPIYDYWELVKGVVSNAVFCGKEAIYTRAYKNLRALPFILMPATFRMPVVTADGSEQARYGDSIYAGKRAMYELESKFSTMVATHAKLLSKQPLFNYIDDESLRLDSTVLFAESVLNLARGKQTIEPSPLKEISPTILSFLGWIEDKIERGQTPRLKLGQPPASGTALNLYREAGNRIYNPQVSVLSRFYGSMCRMIEEQLKAGGIEGDNVKKRIKKIPVETEKEGKYYAFDILPIDLKKPHTIKVEFTVQTPWRQFDIAQQADMLRRQGLPDRWVNEFILKVPDPKLLEDLIVLEIAEKSPMLMMKKAVEVLRKYGRTDDAAILASEAMRMEQEEAMASGQLGPTPAPETEGPVTEAPIEETMPPELPAEGIGL